MANIADVEGVDEYADIVDIAVGDIDGDGIQEIAVATQYYFGRNWVLVYEADLTLRSVFTSSNYVHAIEIENYGGGHRNLLLNTSNTNYYSSGTSFLKLVDPYSGKEVYRSPELPSTVPLNSLHFIDANDDGIQELSYGTRINMNVTR